MIRVRNTSRSLFIAHILSPSTTGRESVQHEETAIRIAHPTCDYNYYLDDLCTAQAALQLSRVDDFLHSSRQSSMVAGEFAISRKGYAHRVLERGLVTLLLDHFCDLVAVHFINLMPSCEIFTAGRSMTKDQRSKTNREGRLLDEHVHGAHALLAE